MGKKNRRQKIGKDEIAAAIRTLSTFNRMFTNAMESNSDLEKEELNVIISDIELAERRRNWQPPPITHSSGVLVKYARLVSSAAEGAVTY